MHEHRAKTVTSLPQIPELDQESRRRAGKEGKGWCREVKRERRNGDRRKGKRGRGMEEDWRVGAGIPPLHILQFNYCVHVGSG